MRTELLAPAGSGEACRSAFMTGADAVYIGGARFGARAYADNPDEGELLELIDLSHRLGKKLYMTVNTLLRDDELENELYAFMKPYAEHGLDGVIVQDFGVADFFRKAFPELPLHASTQMSVTGVHGARMLAGFGFKRIVPAREISLEEIRHIHQDTGIEIEAFAHGAMCYSYSGMCLMSSLIGGRSGNRGRCAGVCRLPFDVYENGGRLNSGSGRYPLNMKDMCTLAVLPEMIDAGVSSFKIEGRMKKPEYTAGVVKIYRKYLDMAEEDPEHYRVDPEDMRYLADLFSRDGFSTGYYRERNGRDMIAIRNEKLERSRAGETSRLIGEVREELHSPGASSALQAGISARAVFRINHPASLEVCWSDGRHRVSVREDSTDAVQKAGNCPVSPDRLRKQLQKTGQEPFFFRSLNIDADEDIFVPMKMVSELRRKALEDLGKEISRQFRKELPGRPETVTSGRKPEQTAGDPSVAVLVSTYEQLRAAASFGALSCIYVPHTFFRDAESCEKTEKILSGQTAVRLALPYILRADGEEKLVKSIRIYTAFCRRQNIRPVFLVRNLEELGLLSEKNKEKSHPAGPDFGTVLDEEIYTMNSRAAVFWRNQGFSANTMSLEMNASEMRRRDNAGTELVVYGRAPMMISAQCVEKTMKGCTRKSEFLEIRDRKHADFPVRCFCDSCYNVIYNSLPTCLLGCGDEIRKTGVGTVRLEFTDEDAADTARITSCFLDEFAAGGENLSDRHGQNYGSTAIFAEKLLTKTTRGHFHRGVE